MACLLTGFALFDVDIRWPTTFSRKLRPLAELVHYKAQELRTFCYVAPVLVDVIENPDVLAMILVFCSAMLLLNKEALSAEHIEKARVLLDSYHLCLRSVFGNGSLRANAHGLQHLADQAALYGPLFTHAAFGFEGHIGSMARLLSGTTGFVRQFVNRYSTKVRALNSRSEGMVDVSLWYHLVLV